VSGKKQKGFIGIFGGLGLAFLVLVGLFLFVLFAPNSAVPRGAQKVVLIERGLNVYQIAGRLHEAGIVRHPGRFVLAAKLLGVAKKLKAGRYEITAEEAKPLRLLRILRSGRVSSIRVTIPEGLTCRQIAGKLHREIALDSARFMAVVRDSALLRQYGLQAPSLEGFLFPDTYDFFWGESERAVVRRMVDHFFAVLPDSVRRKAEEMGWSLVRLVTLASIIQGEAMVKSEMPVISAVYHNRLRRGMLLQADPTLQYLIPNGPRRLTNRDKQIDSPYNTYRYPGLPPGPINNPGLAAIIAAAFPADTPYLYFVANGDGTHTFSRTLREHLRAKRKLDEIRRKVYGKHRSQSRS